MAPTAQSTTSNPFIALRRRGAKSSRTPANVGAAIGTAALFTGAPYGVADPQSLGAAVAILSVAVPAPLAAAELGTYEQLASSGSPLQLRLTAFAVAEPVFIITGTLTVSPAATVIVVEPSVSPSCDPCAFTTTFTGADTLPAVIASPPYRATMLWLPALSVDVLHTAVPAVTAADPTATPLSSNITAPEGAVFPPAAATSDVNVTFCPRVAEAALAETIVVVVASAPCTIT
jgi:hypothetical protein